MFENMLFCLISLFFGSRSNTSTTIDLGPKKKGYFEGERYLGSSVPIVKRLVLSDSATPGVGW